MKTADQAYQENREKIDTQLKELQVALDNMDYEQKFEKANWGFAGNAVELVSMLKEILEFVG